MVLATCWNGRERRAVEFKELLEKSDHRFVMEEVRQLPGMAIGLIEVTWKP